MIFDSVQVDAAPQSACERAVAWTRRVQVRVVCVTTGAGDGDDEVANHWNARGTQAAFRKAGTALAAARARTARPLPAFGVLGVSSKTTRAELRALSKLVDGLPAACA